MGSLIKHGPGDDAVYTYNPIGSQRAYEKVPTSALLQMALLAMRLVWRRRGFLVTPGVRELWRVGAAIAHGRRPALNDDEVFALEDKLPRRDRDDGISIKILASGASALNAPDVGKFVGHVVYLLWDHHKRYDDKSWDTFSSSVVNLLGEAAMLLRDEPDEALERLRDFELACLAHHWSNSDEVVPRQVLADMIGAGSLSNAQLAVHAWRHLPPRAPFPRWKETPEGQAFEAKLAADAARAAAARAAEQARWEAMSPEERAKAEEERAGIRMMLDGLINRTVQ